MPIIGEIVSGTSLGHPYIHKYIWTSCEDCGKERWVLLRYGKPQFSVCRSCGKLRASAIRKAKGIKRSRVGAANAHWKGGRHLDRDGYIYVLIYPGNPYYPMGSVRGEGPAAKIIEHRLVMAQSLGRCLLKTEHVHHKDGDKTHNELSNLELISPKNHILYKQMCAHCELRKEIRLLKWQVKELTQQLQEKLRID